MRVYLDAVFNPLIHSDDEIFSQEGHRLQLEDGTLTRQGVVLNEMRGVFSSPENVGGYKVNETLFRDGSMRHCSGGNPEVIPTLTLEKFRNYHRTHYCTNNAFVVLVSKFNVEKEFALLLEYSKGRTLDKDVEFVKQTEFVDSEEKIHFPASDPRQLPIFVTAYRMYDNDEVSVEDALLLEALDMVIHDSPAAPVKKLVGGHFKSSFDTTQRQTYIQTFCTGSTLPFVEYKSAL